MRAIRWKQVLIYGCLSVAAILWALPIWWTVINATKSTSDFFAHPFYALPREFNLLSNIRTAWDNAGLGTGFINSIIYGVVGASASIVIASLAAYAIVVLRIRGGFTIFLDYFFRHRVPAADVHRPVVQDVQLRRAVRFAAGDAHFLYRYLRAVLHAGLAGFLRHRPERAQGGGASGRGARVPDPALCLCPPVRVGGPGAFPLPVHLDLERPAVRDRLDLITFGAARYGQPEQPDGHLRRLQLAGGTSRYADRGLAYARTFLLPAPVLYPGAVPGRTQDVTSLRAGDPCPASPIGNGEGRNRPDGAVNACDKGANMTEGLLKSTFHDPTAGDRRRDLDQFRAQLEDAVFQEVGTIAGRSLQAVSLPLFKRAQGGLAQVVRFRLAGAGATDLGPQVSLDGDDGAASSPFSFEVKETGLVADAEVPEVSAPTRRHFKVLAANGDIIGEGDVIVRPQRKWSVSLVHHTHLDVGYTDRQEVVITNHLQYLDSVLDLVDHTSSWDDDVRFRWNIEVNWPLERWFECRSERDRGRMIDAIKAGSVSVGAMSLNMHTEACAIEELYEMVRFTVELQTAHGVTVTSAMQTDVPGGVTGLVEVLADVGVQYLSVAHNYAGRSVPYLIGGERLERPFYWRAPSGKRVLVWLTDTLHGNAYMEGNILGLAESYSVTQESLPCYLAGLAERAYPFDSGLWLPEAETVSRPPYPHDILHLRVQGKYGDNAPPNLTVSEVAREWNSKWAFPHLRVDRNEDFFARAEERLGTTIPEWQGDWADWWADGLGSGARMLGWARQAQGGVRVGKTLHALSDVLGGSPAAPVQSSRKTYEDIGLFDEHTWGARAPWQDEEEGWGSGDLQWQRKASFARDAREAAAALVSTGARRAAEHIGGRRGLGRDSRVQPQRMGPHRCGQGLPAFQHGAGHLRRRRARRP